MSDASPPQDILRAPSFFHQPSQQYQQLPPPPSSAQTPTNGANNNNNKTTPVRATSTSRHMRHNSTSRPQSMAPRHGSHARGQSEMSSASTSTTKIVMDEESIQTLLARNRQLEYESEKLNSSLLQVAEDNARMGRLVTMQKRQIDELENHPDGGTESVLKYVFDKEQAAGWFTSKTIKDAVASRDAMQVLLDSVKTEYMVYRTNHSHANDQVEILTESLKRAHEVIEQHAKLFSQAQKQRKEIVLTYSDFQHEDDLADAAAASPPRNLSNENDNENNMDQQAADFASPLTTKNPTLELIAARERITQLENELAILGSKKKNLDDVEISVARSNNNNIMSPQQSSTNNGRKLSDELELARGEAQMLAEQLNTKTVERDLLTSEIEKIRQQNNQFRERDALFRERDAKLRDQNTELRKFVEEVSITNTSLKEQVKSLEGRLDEQIKKNKQLGSGEFDAIIAEQTAKIETLEKQKIDLQKKQSQFEQDIIKKMKEIRQREHELQETAQLYVLEKEKSANFEEEILNLKSNRDSSSNNNNNSNNNNQKSSSSSSSSAEAQKLQDQIKQLQEENKKLESRIQSSALATDGLKQMLDDGNNKIESLKKNNLQIQNELNDAKNQLIDAKTSANSNSKNLETALKQKDDKIQTLENELKQLQLNHDSLASTMRDQTETVIPEQQQYQSRNLQQNSQQEEESNNNEQLVIGLRTELAEKTAFIEKLSKKLKDLAKQQEASQDELANADKELLNARQSHRYEVEELKKEIEKINTSHKSEISKINDAHRVEVDAIKKEHAQIIAKLQQGAPSASQIDDLTKALENEKKQTKLLQHQLDESNKSSEQTLATLKSETSNKINVLESQNKDLSNKIELLSREAQSSNNEFRKLSEEKISELQRQRDAAAEENKVFDEMLFESKQQNEKLIKEKEQIATELKQTSEKQQQTIFQLETKLDSITNDFNKSLERVTRLETENKNLVSLHKQHADDEVHDEELDKMERDIRAKNAVVSSNSSRSTTPPSRQQQQQHVDPNSSSSGGDDIESARRQLIVQHQILTKQRTMVRDYKKKLEEAEKKLEETQQGDVDTGKALQAENSNLRHMVQKLEKRVQVAETRVEDGHRQVEQIQKEIEKEKQTTSRAFKEAEVHRKERERLEALVSKMEKSSASSSTPTTTTTQQQKQQSSSEVVLDKNDITKIRDENAQLHSKLAALQNKYNAVSKHHKLLQEQLDGWRALNESIAGPTSTKNVAVSGKIINKRKLNNNNTGGDGVEDDDTSSNSSELSDSVINYQLDPASQAPLSLDQYRALISQLNALNRDKDLLTKQLKGGGSTTQQQQQQATSSSASSSSNVSDKDIQQFRQQYETKIKALEMELEVLRRAHVRLMATAGTNNNNPNNNNNNNNTDDPAEDNNNNNISRSSSNNNFDDESSSSTATGTKKKKKVGTRNINNKTNTSKRHSRSQSVADDEHAPKNDSATRKELDELNHVVLQVLEKLSQIAEHLLSPLTEPQFPPPREVEDGKEATLADQFADTIAVVDALATQCVTRCQELIAVSSAADSNNNNNNNNSEEQIAAVKKDYEAKIEKLKQDFAQMMMQVEKNVDAAEQNHQQEVEDLRSKNRKLEEESAKIKSDNASKTTAKANAAEFEALKQEHTSLVEKSKADETAKKELNKQLKDAQNELRFQLDEFDRIFNENERLTKDLEVARKKAGLSSNMTTATNADSTGAFSPSNNDNNNDSADDVATPKGLMARVGSKPTGKAGRKYNSSKKNDDDDADQQQQQQHDAGSLMSPDISREFEQLKKQNKNLQEELEKKALEELDTMKKVQQQVKRSDDALKKAEIRANALQSEFEQTMKTLIVPLKEKLAACESFLSKIGVKVQNQSPFVPNSLPKERNQQVIRLEGVLGSGDKHQQNTAAASRTSAATTLRR